MLLGMNQYKRYSLISSFVYTFTYFFPLILLFIFKNPIYLVSGIAIIYSISALIYIFYILKLYKRMGKEKKDYEVEHYKNIIHYSVPLFFSSIMGTSATYIDRIVVSYFVNLSSLGIYNFALVIAGAAPLLVSPVSNLLIPKLSSFFSMDNKIAFKSSIRTLLNLVSLLYIPSALGIAALSRPLLYIFAGKPYEEAYIPLIIIMFMTSLFIGATVLTTGISSIRKTRIYIFSSSLSLISNLLLSVILIPVFSIVGAAVSYSSMNAVNFIIVYYYAKKYEIVNYDLARIAKIWGASILVFALVFAVQSFIPYSMINIFICILFGLIIYLFEIKAFKLINKDEMDYVLSVIPRRFSFIRSLIKNLAYNDKKQPNDGKFRLIK
jgi:O-antigen/teichoic acid export membrane protein